MKGADVTFHLYAVTTDIYDASIISKNIMCAVLYYDVTYILYILYITSGVADASDLVQ